MHLKEILAAYACQPMVQAFALRCNSLEQRVNERRIVRNIGVRSLLPGTGPSSASHKRDLSRVYRSLLSGGNQQKVVMEKWMFRDTVECVDFVASTESVRPLFR